MMFILMLLAFDIPVPSQCVIDMCEDKICTVDTPEGIVYVDKKPHYKEGMPVTCPLWLVEPT